MTRRFFGFLGALTGLALVSGSCVDDPLADLDGSPAAIEQRDLGGKQAAHARGKLAALLGSKHEIRRA